MRNDKDKSYNCRVCGLHQGFKPWGEDGQTPTFDICDCCGVEFGYEDCDVTYIRKFREEWVKNGAKWFSPELMPSSWSLEDQLINVPVEYK
jgi:hypothetical protein